MEGPRPHITPGQLGRRWRRLGGRFAVLGVLVVLGVVGAGLAVILTRGHAGPRTRRRQLASLSPIALAGPRHAGSKSTALAAVMAAGGAEIRRLIPLELPVYCGGPRGRDVAFTFDDGPGVFTHLALRKLEQARDRATFFVVGKSMNSWPGYLPRELKVGAIGDHTYQHLYLVGLSRGQITYQLGRTARMIRAQSGQRVDLWRPPYGAYDTTVQHIARRLGLLEILWSVDSADSLGANWARIITRVEAGLRPGAIILFHENRGQTIRALTTLLPYLRRRHLSSVSLPELFATDPPSAAQLRRGFGGCGEHGQVASGVG